jgi:hypothetical protein
MATPKQSNLPSQHEGGKELHKEKEESQPQRRDSKLMDSKEQTKGEPLIVPLRKATD